MKTLRRVLRRRSALHSGPLFRGMLIQLIDRQPIVISGAGEPLAPVPESTAPAVNRGGRGSLRGQVRIARHFDDPHPGISAAFGGGA